MENILADSFEAQTKENEKNMTQKSSNSGGGGGDTSISLTHIPQWLCQMNEQAKISHHIAKSLLVLYWPNLFSFSSCFVKLKPLLDEKIGG